jgi:hypothetical protein
LLAGTDAMLWDMGVYDGAARAEVGTGALAGFLVAKLLVLLVWGLAALRLVDDPARSLGSALKIDRRQAGWIAGMLLLLPLLAALRMTLTRLAEAVLAPLGADPKAPIIVGAVLYLCVSLSLLARILPGWAGVLIGDRQAGLAWSWRASRGAVLRSVALLMLAIAPAAILHFGINLFWLSGNPLLRAVTLLADGAIIAFFVTIAAAGYATLYYRARRKGIGTAMREEPSARV